MEYEVIDIKICFRTVNKRRKNFDYNNNYDDIDKTNPK